MIELELTTKQIYQLTPLVKELTAHAKKGKPGMIIAQILVPDMVVVVEFLTHKESKAVVEAMKKEKLTNQERLQLLAEKTSLDRMLAGLPESSVIDRMSLEARKTEVEKMLEAGTAK